jgi:hypothetical protein
MSVCHQPVDEGITARLNDTAPPDERVVSKKKEIGLIDIGAEMVCRDLL